MNTALGDIEIVSRLGADERTLAFDVLDGLTRPFKEIPPKHFYDTEGSRLFEQIMGLPEYYPTRAERSILEANAAALVEETARGRAGRARQRRADQDAAAARRDARRRDAGPLRAVRRLRGRAAARAPSCSSSATRASACTASWATSSATSTRCPEPEGPRVIVFLGGTIGNFLPGTRRKFLRSLAPAAARPRTGSCSAPTWSRTRRCSRRPTTTRRA